ncbi:helix-turn-helix domain-containing protein [Bacillus atrophaeus]|uniref:helix-turn-helix domain-containing protein n=1 Tax=Bacillus atrophaeus TaxID=1452 RepID=UPI003F5A4CDF
MIVFKLKWLAEEKGINGMRELSRILDHDYKTVRLMWLGEIKRIPTDFIEKVCIYFDVSINEVMEYKKDENN